MEHQKIIKQMKVMVNLMRKHECIHKKVKLLKEIITVHNHVFELQMLANELSDLKRNYIFSLTFFDV